MKTWVDRDLERHEAEEEKWLASRPICDSCGDPIVEEYTYEIDGEYLCEDCAEAWIEKRKINTEVLIDE